MLAAKLAAPLPLPFRGQPSCLTNALKSRLPLFVAPPGYFHAGMLASTLHEHQRPSLWIRLGREDQDPAQLLLTLIAGLKQFNAEAGGPALERMRCRPGPVAGWPPLFQLAGREMLAALPISTVIVLEGVHSLCGPTPALPLLMRELIGPSLSNLHWMLTTHQPLPRLGSSLPFTQIDQDALRLTERSAMQLAESLQSPLPTDAVRHVTRLTNGSINALLALTQSADELGLATIEHIARQARDGADLMARLAQAWRATLEPEAIHSLQLGMQLTYAHPALLGFVFGRSAPPHGPWWQPLSGDWRHFQACWNVPLRAALRHAPLLKAEARQRAAHCLREHNALVWAIRLLLEGGADTAAAELISEAAPALLDLGQWATLEEWLNALPPETLSSYPPLAFARGELAATRGELSLARRSFAIAGNLYTRGGNSEGACLSWLAESTLAMWQGDYAAATTCAHQSAQTAQSAALRPMRRWAHWQLGCLAVAANQIDAAMENFACATALCDEGDELTATEDARRTEALARYWHDVHEQREYHQQAYALAVRAETRASERLRTAISSVPVTSDAVLRQSGWSRTPLMTKLNAPPALSTLPQPGVPLAFSQVWHAIMDWFHQRPAEATPVIPVLMPPLAPAPGWREPPREREMETTWAVETVIAEPAPVTVVETAPALIEPPALQAQMLGSLRLALNGRSVEELPKGKALAVLKYLLLQRGQPVVRDVLMDVFWPEAEPESVRNRLNVTLHALRQSLRAVTDRPIVVFEAGAYRLNPEFTLQMDIEAFERHVESGHRWEAGKNPAQAAAEYEAALNLYTGDLLADDLYESWPVLLREKLRVAFLDSLDRLSQIHFAAERYEQCVVQCLRLLQRDNCREDAHCRLMRSYSRMGQPHQALRQYEACLGALRAELDTDPSPATTRLYQRIRQHEAV